MRKIQYNNEYMLLLNDGTIQRESWPSSGQWKVIGAVTYNNFRHIINRYTLQEILDKGSSIPWKHKNGKQKTFIQDIDHGTIRIWGNDHKVF